MDINLHNNNCKADNNCTKKFDQGHALLIGVGKDLPNTTDDAIGLASILKDSTRCGYPENQVQLLTEQTATRDLILDHLSHLAQRTTSQSTVIIYFSGHGYKVSTTIGEEYFLMPYDYDINALSRTAISGTELAQKLSLISSQKLLLLLDCCHAGGLDVSQSPLLTFTKSPIPAQLYNLLAQGNGRIIIASSKADELSYAGQPYSAFTLALVEALAGVGVAKQDGFVRVADLALYAREMVPRRTKEKQHPILNFENADNFIVAYYAGGATQPKSLSFSTTPEIEPEPGLWKTQKYQKNDIRSNRNINIRAGSRSVVVTGGRVGSINTGDNK